MLSLHQRDFIIFLIAKIASCIITGVVEPKFLLSKIISSKVYGCHFIFSLCINVFISVMLLLTNKNPREGYSRGFLFVSNTSKSYFAVTIDIESSFFLFEFASILLRSKLLPMLKPLSSSLISFVEGSITTYSALQFFVFFIVVLF